MMQVSGELETLDGAIAVHFPTQVVNLRRAGQTDDVVIAASADSSTALERRELSFRQVLMTAAEAVVMSDAEGRILFANPMAATFFGYTAQELYGLSVDVLVPERFRAKHRQQLTKYAIREGLTSLD